MRKQRKKARRAKIYFKMYENKNISNRISTYEENIKNLCKILPETKESELMKEQLMHSIESVLSIFNEAQKAHNKQEFLSKMALVINEANECTFWIDLVIEVGMITEDEIVELVDKGYDLLDELNNIKDKNYI